MAERGRPKGSTNHDNKAIKDMLREALDKAGGADYFYRQAMENPNTFCGLVGKIIPNELTIDAAIKHQFEPLVIKGIEK